MLTLRPHQQEVVDKLREGFNEHRCQILYAPTGFGKTEVAMAIMQEVAKNYQKTAIVLDRVVLIEQTSLRLGKYGIDHGVIQANHWRSRPHLPIQVCSAQTLEKRKIIPDIDMLIIDECHVSRRGTIELIKNNPNLKVIGLTATPFTNGLGNIYSNVVGALSTGELIDKGWLTPLKVFIAKEIDMTGVTKVAGEWSADQTTERGMRITGDIVTEWIKKTHEIYGAPKKTIVFCSGVEHGRDIQEKFKQEGYNFVSISYKEDDDFKRETIEDFSRPDTTIHGLIATDILTRGFDVSDVLIGVSARPFSKSFSSHVQQLGRVMRPHDGKEFAIWLDHCIASGQKVLTHRGLVAIEEILISDTIWDGHEFVSHKGVVSRGKRPVITYAGITATPDHLVKTRDEGWCSLGYCAEKQKSIITTGFGRKNLRECDDYFTGYYLAWSKASPIYACFMRMHNLRLSVNYFFDKLAKWKNKGMSSVQSAQKSSGMAECKDCRNEVEMPKSTQERIRKLWWKGNPVQIRFSDFLRSLDSRELGMLATSQGYGIGSDRQQWTLRIWKYSLGNQGGKYQQSKNIKVDSIDAQVQNRASGNKLRRFDFASIIKRWFKFSSDRREISSSVSEAERQVWDILDCGPRNSFTCEGLLVHNSGNYLRFRNDWDKLYEHGVTELKDGAENPRTEPTEREKKEAHCPSCNGLWTSNNNICDECGFERKNLKDLVIVPGELTELDVANRKLIIDKQKFYSQVLYYSRSRGYKDGWAANKYKEKFQVWPRGLDQKVEVPEPATLSWIKSRMIAYAKGKQKANQ
jgi:superfamily II DNA or RNA helicase